MWTAYKLNKKIAYIGGSVIGARSDEFRIFWNLEDGIYRIDYWFMDWYDGKITLNKHHDDFSLLRRIIYNEYLNPGLKAIRPITNR